MNFEEEKHSAINSSDNLRITKDGAPSDLTLARARQSVKTEGIHPSYDGSSQDTEISERIFITKNGERTIYEAAVPCNRCGACAAVCPSYRTEIKENFSPRGRCQLTRLLKEYRIKKPEEALNEAISSCLLCGACENLCHASIPVPEIMLELRRRYLKQKPGLIRKLALRLKLNHSKIYSFWLKTAFIMLKLRLKWFAKIIGIAPLTGRTQSEFEEMDFNPPLKFASDILKDYAKPPKHTVKWVYFSSCETNYLMPSAAQATVELLSKHFGEGMMAGNLCCGFMSYRYGNLEEAKNFAKKNIEIFENLRKLHGDKFIVVTDCSSCAAFLKNYEQLFIKEKKEEDFLSENCETVNLISGGEEYDNEEYAVPVPEKEENDIKNDAAENGQEWRKRARDFAEAVRDISELLKPNDFSKISRCAEEDGKNVCYQPACSAIYAQKINAQPVELLTHLCGKSLKDFKDSSMCCGGNRGNIAVPLKITASAEKNKIMSLANAQAEIIVSTDPCCINAINAKAKKWYPSAKACHFSVYVNDLEKRHRKSN